MWQDFRQAVRTLVKHPQFVVLAGTVLALGVGLNIAIFSIVHALLYTPLSVAASHELVSIYQIFPRQPDRPTVVHTLIYDFLKEHNEVFTDITAHWGISYALRADDATDQVNAEWVLSNYFDVLGVKPVLGRTLLPAEDDVANPARAVVISHDLWTRRFQSDRDILGKQIDLGLGGQSYIPYTVVGVMPSTFKGVSDPWKPTQLWITMAQGRERPERLWSGIAIARLRQGVSIDQGRAVVGIQGRQWYYSRPDAEPEYEQRLILYRTNEVRMPFDPSAALIPRRLAAAMTIVVAVVLLVAGANIAGILMARGIGRSGEIAVRRVLGAGSLRIARQLLAESVLLTFVGGALGFAFASCLIRLFRALTPVRFAFDVSMDGSVVLFTTVICLVSGGIVGLLPARQAVRLDVLPWLAGSGIQTRETRARLRHAVTLPQIICSLVLLLIACVYVRALMRVELADLGYAPGNLLVAHPALRVQPGEMPTPGRRTGADANLEERHAQRARRFYAQLLERLRALPGTRHVAIASALPLREPSGRPNWSVVSQEAFLAGERDGTGVERTSVSPGYFPAMAMTIIAGREFDDRDTGNTPKVVVVSAGLAQRVWPGRDPIRQTLTLINNWNRNEKKEWYSVVGIVNDVSPILHDAGARPFVYLPLGQEWRPGAYNLLVRANGDSRTLIPAVKDAVARADPFAEVYRLRTMSQMAAEILYPRRIAAAILAGSAIIAVFLATLGVYGVVAYSVAQRTGEIGVRMALGADRADITALILREGLAVASFGSLAGLALGWTAVRLTSSNYLALPHVDVWSLLITPLLLGAVVLLACYVPARRAGYLDPMDVLRRS